MNGEDLSLNYQQHQVSQEGLGKEESIGVMRELLDTEKVILNVDFALSGKGINPSTGQWEEQEGRALLSDELRYKIISSLRIRLNPITLFANITQEMIERICYDLHMDLAELLAKNPGGIICNNLIEEDRWTRAYMIHDDIMDAIWIGLTQPKDAGQRRMMSKIGGWSESNVTTQQQAKKKKIFGIF